MVIETFRHKGLKKFFYAGIVVGINPNHAERVRKILALLNTAESPIDMDLPGLKLHELKGNLKGRWAVSVSGNFRVTFAFLDGHVCDVDYEDYH